jgi:hypothetical protein
MAENLNRAYIDSKLDAILHAMTTKTFLANPADHIEFMLQYLEENHGKRQGINADERVELEHLRKEVTQLKEQLNIQSDGDADGSTNSNANSESSEEENEEVVEL